MVGLVHESVLPASTGHELHAVLAARSASVGLGNQALIGFRIFAVDVDCPLV